MKSQSEREQIKFEGSQNRWTRRERGKNKNKNKKNGLAHQQKKRWKNPTPNR
jgi:hypothetical protein